MLNTPSQAQPTLLCPKLEREIEISGRLQDPLWQKAAMIELKDAVSGGSGRFATLIYTGWTDRFLYVAFDCKDDYVWGTFTMRDDPVYDEECVEIFLDPAGCGHYYFEVNLSPKNVLFDAFILNDRREDRPHASFSGLAEFDLKDIKTATSIHGQPDQPGDAMGWIAEYAIPIKELYGAPNQPPRPGDIWRINFYRIDSPRAGEQELYAWSPTLRGTFHLPWRFGFLKFGQ